ncbi:hypothetical protein GCM10025786_32330 [Nocardioides caeni]
MAPGFADVAALYDELDAKVVVYCNNSMLNFNSLLDGRMLHVHINHGESDKQSMVSNNAKAYDRVFVAGEAAVQRHRTALMELDESKLVRVGRPQLDLRPEPLLAPSARRTVLYAPTWEGDADYNDYTSVDLFGPSIVESVLAVTDMRLVYKPHPKVTTSRTPAIREAHRAILRRIGRAARQEPDAGHRAVVLDVPISRCADVVDADTLPDLTDLLSDRLDHDEHHIARAAMRRHYFDEIAVGDSTARFTEAVTGLVALRDTLQGAAVVGAA